MGTVFAVKHFEIHDGPGVRTTVFFKGCPLRCGWCHNPEGLHMERQLAYHAEKCVRCGACCVSCAAHSLADGRHVFNPGLCHACGSCEKACPAGALTLYGKEVTVSALLPELLQDKVYYDLSSGGVTLSGGEPLLQPGFAEELLKALRENGVSAALDTCGFAPWSVLSALLPYLDCVLYDVKAADEAVHRRLTGQSNRVILDNLRRLDGAGMPLYIRVPYVPVQNDAEMAAIGEILKPLRNVREVKVLPYHAFSSSLYTALSMEYPLEGNPFPMADDIAGTVAMFREMGLPAVNQKGRQFVGPDRF